MRAVVCFYKESAELPFENFSHHGASAFEPQPLGAFHRVLPSHARSRAYHGAVYLQFLARIGIAEVDGYIFAEASRACCRVVCHTHRCRVAGQYRLAGVFRRGASARRSRRRDSHGVRTRVHKPENGAYRPVSSSNAPKLCSVSSHFTELEAEAPSMAHNATAAANIRFIIVLLEVV